MRVTISCEVESDEETAGVRVIHWRSIPFVAMPDDVVEFRVPIDHDPEQSKRIRKWIKAKWDEVSK
jgi:hypothetical protein